MTDKVIPFRQLMTELRTPPPKPYCAKCRVEQALALIGDLADELHHRTGTTDAPPWVADLLQRLVLVEEAIIDAAPYTLTNLAAHPTRHNKQSGD